MKKILLFLVFTIVSFVSRAQLSADFSADNTALDCNSQCINFTDLTTGGVPSLYQWFFPGAVPATSSSSAPVNICYAADGSYDVTLIVSDGINTDTVTK